MVLRSTKPMVRCYRNLCLAPRDGKPRAPRGHYGASALPVVLSPTTSMLNPSLLGNILYMCFLFSTGPFRGLPFERATVSYNMVCLSSLPYILLFKLAHWMFAASEATK